MNKSLLVKIGIAAFLLAGFAGYNAYTKWSNTHFKVDPKAFNIVSNLKSIIDDEFKGFPPLKSAYHHHLLEDVNQSIALPNIRREIKVHKIWFIFPKMYVLYSLNLHKNDKGTKDIPRLRFPSMTFMVNGKELEASITPSDLPSEEKGKVFNGRLYRGVLLTPNFEDILTEDFRFNQFLKNLKAVQLKDPKLVTPNSKKKDNEIPIKGLELTFRHNIDKYQLFEVPLNKKFKLDNGQQLIFKKFTAGVRVNKLFYTLKGKNKSNIFFLNIRETQSSLPADLPI
ncbi:MAG TPA: hypothetical protein VFK37_10235, partial [Bacillales bacterium]|nr:hypothetical protein [Bacillales bacterium]